MKKLQIAFFFLLFLILSICLGFTISHWPNSTDCTAPIRTAPLFFIILFFALAFTSYRLQTHLPHCYRKWLIYFENFLLYPTLIYLTIQGIRWVLSQKCQAEEGFYAIGIGIGIMCIFGALFTVIEVIALRDWWFGRRSREREQNNPRPNGFYLAIPSFNGDIERQNQYLRLFEDFLMKLGLFPSDLARLKRRKFSQPVGKMSKASHLETCSVCYEDYCVGDEIVSLPKCKHVFHWECGTRWLLRSPFCPLCRNNVRSSWYHVRIQPIRVVRVHQEPL